MVVRCVLPSEVCESTHSYHLFSGCGYDKPYDLISILQLVISDAGNVLFIYLLATWIFYSEGSDHIALFFHFKESVSIRLLQFY